MHHFVDVNHCAYGLMPHTKTITIHDLRQLSRSALEAIIDRAEIKAQGACTAPPLDLEQIKDRATALPIDHELRDDFYRLIHEVEKLRKGNNGDQPQ